MKISKSLNGEDIKFIVRSGKNIVFRADSLEDAKDFVAGKKVTKKKAKEDVEEILEEDVIVEDEPKKKVSFFSK